MKDKAEKPSYRHLIPSVLIFGLVAGFLIAIVTIPTAMNSNSGEEEAKGPTSADIKKAEAAKMAFIEEHRPEWYDVDPHGVANYVTYKIIWHKTGAIGICRGPALPHHDGWFVIPAKRCEKIGQAKHMQPPKKEGSPRPPAALESDSEPA